MPESAPVECRLAARMSATRAVAFDFNGTLSHDEPILFAIYRELFSAHGRPLSAEDYYGTLAGLSEEAIIGTWLGIEGERLSALVEERIERYLARSGDGETVTPDVREAVAYAAARVPVAVVSGAFRREIEPVLAGAGLDRRIAVLVAADDVERGKPDPAGYAACPRAARRRPTSTRGRRPRRHAGGSCVRQGGRGCAASRSSERTRRSACATPMSSSR